MEEISTPLIVGVRFSKVGKVYHFESNGLADLKVGDMVVVETSRGWQLGQVAQVLKDAVQPPEGWKSIDRRATPRDLLLRQLWQQKESEVVGNCKARAEELRLSGIKIVEAEYSFDGSRLTILFSSETEEKYDLKSLRGDMQKMFAPSQVEMRQIGPRDVAKTVCGMGACGLETRCCCSFLTEFSSISIRMAKEQGISLTPTEITGMCGRLRCCLIYEYDQYVDARKTLPKRNKWVKTPDGEGKVVDLSPLQDIVEVEIPEVGRRRFTSTEVTPIVVETLIPKGAKEREEGEEGEEQPAAKSNPPAAVDRAPETASPSAVEEPFEPQAPGSGEVIRGDQVPPADQAPGGDRRGSRNQAGQRNRPDQNNQPGQRSQQNRRERFQRPQRSKAPTEGENIPVAREPSEIDQAITGFEVSPDPVDGVGDHHPSSQERPPRDPRDRRRSMKGPRGQGGAERQGQPGQNRRKDQPRQPRENRPQGEAQNGQPSIQGDADRKEGKGPQSPQDRGSQQRGPADRKNNRPERQGRDFRNKKKRDKRDGGNNNTTNGNAPGSPENGA